MNRWKIGVLVLGVVCLILLYVSYDLMRGSIRLGIQVIEFEENNKSLQEELQKYQGRELVQVFQSADLVYSMVGLLSSIQNLENEHTLMAAEIMMQNLEIETLSHHKKRLTKELHVSQATLASYLKNHRFVQQQVCTPPVDPVNDYFERFYEGHEPAFALR